MAHKPRIVMYNKVDALSEVNKYNTVCFGGCVPVVGPPTRLCTYLSLTHATITYHVSLSTQEEAAAWSEEVMQMMLEQEDAAKARAAGPSTLGSMAEENKEGRDEEDEDEERFMELAVAGSGMTGQGALGFDVYVCVDVGVSIYIKPHDDPLTPNSNKPNKPNPRHAGPAAGDGRGAALHHGARRGGAPLLRGLHAQPGALLYMDMGLCEAMLPHHLTPHHPPTPTTNRSTTAARATRWSTRPTAPSSPRACPTCVHASCLCVYVVCTPHRTRTTSEPQHTNTSTNQTTQDLAFKLLPYRVDAGARAHHERAAGEEIDWAALAKGRHTYKQRLQRGEVTALSASASAAGQEEEQQQESVVASASAGAGAAA